MYNKTRQTIRLRPLIYAVAVFFSMLTITQYLSYQQYALDKSQEKQVLLRELGSTEQRFRYILNSNITAANTLAIIYKDFGVQHTFDSVATHILAGSKFVETIQITENGIIKYVFPLHGYENTIGINTYKDPLRRKEELKAIEKNSIYFTGPRKLRQGGIGILGKAPVRLGLKSNGMVVVLTKIPTIVKALDLADSSKNKFAYLLLKKNAFGHTEQYKLTTTLRRADSKPVSTHIPEGDWQLQVAYSDNFIGAQFPNTLSVFSLLLSVIAAILAYNILNVPYRLNSIIDSKTNLLGERIKELATIYQVNDILQKQAVLNEQVFPQIVELLPQGWQYPEVCQAAINFDGRLYTTKGFGPFHGKQVSHFRLSDNRKGNIEIIYTTEMPSEIEGPFLKEERDLIDALAEIITIYFNKALHERSLLQSQARFRAAFEHAAIGMALVSLEGQWIMVNSELCNMLGYTEQELLSIDYQAITHPDDLENDLLLNSELLRGDRDYFRIEKRYKHKSGTDVMINHNVALVRDDNGQPLYFVSQLENITLQVEAQTKFRDLVEKSLVGVYILQDERMVYANPRIVEESGYTEEELATLPLELLVHKDDLPLVNANIEARFNGVTDEVRYEARIITKKGGIIWLEMFGRATPYKGNPALIGTLVNITDKKAFYDDLLTSNSNIQSIFNNTNVNYLLLDADFSIVSFNDQMAVDFYRQTGNEIEVGKNFINLLPTERKVLVSEMFNKVISTGIPIEYEVAYGTDTKIEYIYNTITPILRTGKTIGLCLSGFDITKRKLLELEHQKTIKNLIQRNKDLEQFSQIISHNVRAPLATIMGLCTLLMEEGTEADKQLRLEYLSLSANKLDSVVHDLNDILSIRGEQSEHYTIVNLEQLVQDIKTSISLMVSNNKALVMTDFSALGELCTVKPYLTSIFYNFITNGIRHAEPGRAPEIKIWTEKRENIVDIYFRDNGMGIDLAKNGKKLFELYQRFNYAVDGKGTGLYMTKTHVDMLGGEIDVQSQLTVGTTFRVSLPLVPCN